jgi:hypothetical protein
MNHSWLHLLEKGHLAVAAPKPAAWADAAQRRGIRVFKILVEYKNYNYFFSN